MKTSKKILIAVGAVVLIAAVVIGIVIAVNAGKKTPVPELELQKLHESPLYYSQVYVVGQPPYSDDFVFDTPLGMDTYWIANHTGGNGIEFVLQQTKDGELIVLSEAFPALSNAEDLYGKGVKANDLTLEELRKINLAYNYVDEDGIQSFVGISDEELKDVSVVTLEEMLKRFDTANRITARLYLRFFDESQVNDIDAALQKIYAGLQTYSLTEKVVFLPQSKASAEAADKACPEMLRAATTAEAKELVRNSTSGTVPEDLPYSVIYEKATGKFADVKFIRFVRTMGLEIVLTDVDADDVLRFRDHGVTAIASSDAPTFIQILKDAKKAERESRKAESSSAQQ